MSKYSGEYRAAGHGVVDPKSIKPTETGIAAKPSSKAMELVNGLADAVEALEELSQARRDTESRLEKTMGKLAAVREEYSRLMEALDNEIE